MNRHKYEVNITFERDKSHTKAIIAGDPPKRNPHTMCKRTKKDREKSTTGSDGGIAGMYKNRSINHGEHRDSNVIQVAQHFNKLNVRVRRCMILKRQFDVPIRLSDSICWSFMAIAQVWASSMRTLKGCPSGD